MNSLGQRQGFVQRHIASAESAIYSGTDWCEFAAEPMR
jgi:hypothetical protein